MTSLRMVFHLLISVVLFIACAGDREAQDRDSSMAETLPNSKWQSLVSLEHWRGFRADSMPTGWTVEGGMLIKRGVGSDIVSRNQYSDFEWELEWKLDSGGNAGLFYRATEEYDRIYWSAPEYALLDNARHPDGANPLTTAGAVHSLHAPPPGVAHEAGQWNTTRIVARGPHVEHWLNGQKVAEFEYGSADFLGRVAQSKFSDWPNFAKAQKGLLGIQGDHGGVLTIRNMRIRE